VCWYDDKQQQLRPIVKLFKLTTGCILKLSKTSFVQFPVSSIFKLSNNICII